jgi:radical SAM protein with 4Fe4S-binding SPASM domain
MTAGTPDRVFFRDRILVRREHFGTLVLCRDGRRFHVDDSHFALLADIAAAPRDEGYRIPCIGPSWPYPRLTPERTHRLINELVDKRILTRHPKEAGAAQVVDLPSVSEDCLSFPRTVYWECTSKCNFQCVHCYSESGPRGRTEKLPLSSVRDLMEELGRCGTEFLSIGGGEPLMYRELPHVVSSARAAGLEVEVTTNGSLAVPSRIARLQEAGLRFVQLSLDGATAETFESIRKGGKFTQVVENAEHLADAFTLTVSAVAVRENLSEIPALIDLAKKIGAAYFRVIPLMPSGRGRTASAPSAAQMRALHELVRERQRAESTIVVQFNENLVDPRRKNIPWMPEAHYGCPAGRTTCGIDADGNVYPCSFMQDARLIAGNVRDSTLAEIWRHSDVLRAVREVSQLEEPCGTCTFLRTCRGGCRASAVLSSGGNLNASDPLCSLS